MPKAVRILLAAVGGSIGFWIIGLRPTWLDATLATSAALAVLGLGRSVGLRGRIALGSGGVLLPYVIWQFIRPFNIFVPMPQWENPIEVTVPQGLKSVDPRECGSCHTEIYQEWRNSIKSWSSTEPYFRADWGFDHGQSICFLCHAGGLRPSLPRLVLGYHDIGKYDPIEGPNPDYDASLFDQGTACAACHVRNGRIRGPFEPENSPHPVLVDPEMGYTINVCLRCHGRNVYPGQSVGAGGLPLLKRPPSGCGTLDEQDAIGVGNLDYCPTCHMPPVVRPVVPGGRPREGRRHLFLGGHHPEFVRNAVEVHEEHEDLGDRIRYRFTLENVASPHMIPTGIPDRKILLGLKLLDGRKEEIESRTIPLQRFVTWKPVIAVWKDNRLAFHVPQTYSFEVDKKDPRAPVYLDVSVIYHLVGERRRAYENYRNTTPISYPIYRARFQAMSGAPDPTFQGEGEHLLCSGTTPERDRVPPHGYDLIPGHWLGDPTPAMFACKQGDADGIQWPFW